MNLKQLLPALVVLYTPISKAEEKAEVAIYRTYSLDGRGFLFEASNIGRSFYGGMSFSKGREQLEYEGPIDPSTVADLALGENPRKKVSSVPYRVAPHIQKVFWQKEFDVPSLLGETLGLEARVGAGVVLDVLSRSTVYYGDDAPSGVDNPFPNLKIDVNMYASITGALRLWLVGVNASVGFTTSSWYAQVGAGARF